MGIQEELIQKQNRYREETKAIKSQVEFIEESVILATVREKRAHLTNAIIEENKLDSDIFNKANQMIESLIQYKESMITQFSRDTYYEIPEEFNGIDMRSYEGETIQYILNMIENGKTDAQLLYQDLVIHLEAMCIVNGEKIGGEFYLDLYDNSRKINQYIDVCLKLNHNLQMDSLGDNIKQIEHHIKLINLINPQNPINIYRQAFIQLIAVFDVMMFEIFQIRFKSDFFNWLKFFKGGSVKYSEIANCSTFDKFQNTTINEKLKACYLKDLLIIARNYLKDIFIIDEEDCYSNFREMINRRNCHIHNNGIVDNSYLGLDNAAHGEFNIFSYAAGDYLLIDKEYFIKSINMCDNFIAAFLQAQIK